jgi:uncharacterized membrane protein YgdD (TMEM256/DUF423 family)
MPPAMVYGYGIAEANATIALLPRPERLEVQMPRTFLLLAAILGFLGVALGAFGAHALESRLEASGRTDTYETANRYHLLHAVALLGVALVGTQIVPVSAWLVWAGNLLFLGTLIFSGSLYLLAIFDIRWMGAIAPIGGVMLLAGWLSLGVAAWQWTTAATTT